VAEHPTTGPDNLQETGQFTGEMMMPDQYDHCNSLQS